MIRRAFRLLLLTTLVAFPGAVYALEGPDVLPTEGQEALKAEYAKWNGVWAKMINGDPPADPTNAQHQQAIDVAAKYFAYRLTWGYEREPGKINDLFRELNSTLESIHNGKEKTQKTGELFTNKLIAHASDVLKTNKAVSRLNGARLLTRIVDQAPFETQADVVARLAGTNEADLADVLTTAINDPAQIDAVKYWAFRALRYLLALPQPAAPVLPRAKEEAALEAVVKFLQDRNKELPPETPQAQIDGLRMVQREAIAALAMGRFPTQADKSRPAWLLLKVAARDGILPEPRLDSRIEAAIGTARARADLDKDYQPDYAAHQLALFVADFGVHYAHSINKAP